MSTAAPFLAPHSLSAWLSLDALDSAFGVGQVRQALVIGTQYVALPTLAGDGEIRASMKARERRGYDVFGSRGRRPPVVVASVRPNDAGTMTCACSCDEAEWSRKPCAHVVALVVDMAVHPPFASAILGRHPNAGGALDELPAARHRALSERAALDAFAGWLAPREVEAIELAVEPIVESYGYGADGHQELLLVRVRRAGQRACLAAREIDELSLGEADRRLLELTRPSHTTRKAVVADGPLASVLLGELAQRGDAWLGLFRGRATFGTTPVRPRVRLEGRAPGEPVERRRRSHRAGDAEHDERLVVEWTTDGSDDIAAGEGAILFAGPSPWLWAPRSSTFHPVAADVSLSVAARLQRRPVVDLPRAHRERIGQVLYSGMRGRGVALPPRDVLGLPGVETPRFVLRLAGSPLAVHGHLEAVYSSRTVALPAPATAACDERDLDAEAAAVALVRAGALACTVDTESGAPELVAEDEAAIDLWQRGLPAVRASESPRVEVQLADTLARVRVGAPVRARVSVGLVGGWLDANVDLCSEDLAVEIEAVRAALTRGSRWVTLSDGALARIGDAVETLAKEAAEVAGEDGSLRLPAHQLGRLARWVDEHGGTVDAAVSEFRSRLRALAVSADPRLPAGLGTTLRPYQRQGLAWLQWLEELGAGGILADDMGLGKTLMALAFLARQKEERGEAPSLVVCPTSVAPGWVREAQRFTPDLRVYLYHGAGREEEAMGASDLVVTTYALLRREVDKLARIDFRTVIADEAQNIKNPDAATTLAAKKLRASVRLALSGTPVENRLRELWSIADFVNPGMLGAARAFEGRFERPIASSPSGPVAGELRGVMRPFVLRRTKEEVLTDLPPKTEIERTCTLGTAQKRLYDALSHTVRESVAAKVAEVGLARAGLNVLTALLRLRQMACDPRLVDPSSAAPSAKRVAFLEIVRELAAEGRRALVFSQFVELLKLWRKDLDAEGIAYEYLDGGTDDRAEVVDRFQRGRAPLFLISLKAGGAGLNLTAADTVIHCDPWWNPAVEDQATDRAHRIGQERPVTVVRLVAKGTVEEKIGALKTAKREIADAVVGAASGADALRGLTQEDLDSLLGAAEGDAADDAEATPLPPPVAPVELSASPSGVVEVEALRAIARGWLSHPGRSQSSFGARVGLTQPLVSKLVRGQAVRIGADVARRIRDIAREADDTGRPAAHVGRR